MEKTETGLCGENTQPMTEDILENPWIHQWIPYVSPNPTEGKQHSPLETDGKKQGKKGEKKTNTDLLKASVQSSTLLDSRSSMAASLPGRFFPIFRVGVWQHYAAQTSRQVLNTALPVTTSVGQTR